MMKCRRRIFLFGFVIGACVVGVYFDLAGNGQGTAGITRLTLEPAQLVEHNQMQTLQLFPERSWEQNG